MSRSPKLLSCLVLLLASLVSTQFAFADFSTKPVKEWTFMTFMNGNNNLDMFGAANINAMEKVGSNDQLNIVVQWASLKRKATQRLYVKKDDSSAVTSPVIQEIGNPDMGDWRTLVDFIRWTVQNYPAKRYFINVWNHGNGWRLMNQVIGDDNLGFQITDISHDDLTGHWITTPELGKALAEAAKLIGHKVDLYASDACLMSMVEIADELADSVKVYAGSEEVEPGEGWPYTQFLTAWQQRPQMEAAELGKTLSTEYLKAYTGGVYGREEVTFSVLDLEKISPLNQAIARFGKRLAELSAPQKSTVLAAASKAMSFTYLDYVDLLDFAKLVEAAKLPTLEASLFSDLRSATQSFVIANDVTSYYRRATGVAIWLPSRATTYREFTKRYDELKFQAHTNWGGAVQALHNP